MQYIEAMAAIKRGDLKQLYLISGEETYLTGKVERAILEKLLPDQKDGDVKMLNGDVALDELVHMIESAPFFSEKNIILVRNTMLFKEKKKAADAEKSSKANQAEEKLIKLFEDMPPYSTLILETPEKADKRRKLYKAVVKCGSAVEVARIRAWEVKDWLTVKLREIDKEFERSALEYFLEVTSVMNQISLGFLDQEIDKLALYADKKTIVKRELQEVLASVPEVSIFSMLDAISDKNTKKALRLLNEQLNAGEHPLKMITMLSRHTRQLWQAKRCAAKGYQNKQIAEKLGLVPFIAEKLTAKSKRFSEDALKNATVQFAEADYKLKSGQADCALLENIVISLCA